MSGSNGIKRYNGVEQDDEGAYVYYDEHIAALRRARVEGMREAITIITRAVTWTPQSVLEILERLARIAELERAAQIEEGEHDDSHTSND